MEWLVAATVVMLQLAGFATVARFGVAAVGQVSARDVATAVELLVVKEVAPVIECIDKLALLLSELLLVLALVLAHVLMSAVLVVVVDT